MCKVVPKSVLDHMEKHVGIEAGGNAMQWVIINFPSEDFNNTGELAPAWLKCLCVARMGRPHSKRAVNMLARAVTKWNKACAKILARLTSKRNNTKHYIHY